MLFLAARDREKKRASGLALLILGFLVSNQEAAAQMEAFGMRCFETLAKGLAVSGYGRKIQAGVGGRPEISEP